MSLPVANGGEFPMKHPLHRQISATVATLVLSILIARDAPAAGLYQDGAGARAMGMGGTGTAVAADPLDALFDNPAALGQIDHLTAQLGVHAGVVMGDFHNRVNDDSTMTDAGVIGQAAVSLPLGPVHLALGVNPDIAARTDWRYADAPGGADGHTTYGVRPNDSQIVLLRTALGASVSPLRTLSIGANVGLLYNQNVLRAPYVFQSQPTLRTAKTLLDLETDGFGWNAQGGLRWQPIDPLTVSISYTSRSRIETDGRATGNARAQFNNLGLGAARSDFAYDAEVTNIFPQQLSAGLAWSVTHRLTLSAQFDWINWSDAFEKLPVHLTHGNNTDLNGVVGSSRLDDTIPLRWSDQYVGRLGAERKLTDHWTVRAGYAYGNNPVPDNTLTPLTAAITEHLLTAGRGLPCRPRHDRRRLPMAGPGDRPHPPQRPRPRRIQRQRRFRERPADQPDARLHVLTKQPRASPRACRWPFRASRECARRAIPPPLPARTPGFPGASPGN